MLLRHVAQPHRPFEHETGEAGPQHRVDPMMCRLVGRRDSEHHHHGDAGCNGDMGRCRHVAAGGGGGEMCQGEARQGKLIAGCASADPPKNRCCPVFPDGAVSP
jgi:hypothetical protein